MICLNCGRENKDNNKFCFGCGVSLGKEVQVVNSVNKEAQDREMNERLISIVKKIFNVASIIVIICFVVALFCVIFVIKPEKKSSSSVSYDICYNMRGDLNEIYI